MKRGRQSPERPKKRNHGTTTNNNNNNPRAKKAAPNNPKDYIKTGNIGTFLDNYNNSSNSNNGNVLSDERLIGNLPNPDDDGTAYSNLLRISQFMADYNAMSTLLSLNHHEGNNSGAATAGAAAADNTGDGKRGGTTSTNSTASATTTATTYYNYYLPTIREFAQTQLERQSAGLRTNTNSQTSSGMHQIVESHGRALREAMNHARTVTTNGSSNSSYLSSHPFLFPSKATLCRWHGMLMMTETRFSSSSFRTSMARAGTTLFCPPQSLDVEFTALRNAMQYLYAKWESVLLHQSNNNNNNNNATSTTTASSNSSKASPEETRQMVSIYHAVALAAICLYGLTDIHMYSDGNGRLSRICTNWMLQRILKLPFTITLAANPQQRREYIDALKQGLHSIRAGKTNGGIFKPLIHLLLDRMAHAIQECQRKLTERSQAVMAEEEARIARTVRERAAQGQCIICLDEKPNIATLCCGQAVHLNCVAEWLANASNCVGCRAPLPPMKLPSARSAPAAAAAAAPAQQQPFRAELGGLEVVEIHENFPNGNDNDDDDETSTNPLRGNLLDLRDTLQGIINRQEYQAACPCGVATIAPLCSNRRCSTCCARMPFGCQYHDPTPPLRPNVQEPEQQQQQQQQQNNNNNVAQQQQQQQQVEDTTTTSIPEPEPQYCAAVGCRNLPASDCGNGMCGNCCSESGSIHCVRHEGLNQDTTTTSVEDDDDDDDDDDEDTSTTSMGFANNDNDDDDDGTTTVYQPTCNYCSNRAAVDCNNGMCGRCCILNGVTDCPRHNNC